MMERGLAAFLFELRGGSMISQEFHKSRRRLYQDLLKDNSMGFVFSGEHKEDRGDQMFPFTPYANFYYLTGFEQPKAIFMAVKKGGGKKGKTFFFYTTREKKNGGGGFF